MHYNKLIDINNYNDVAAAISENSLVDSIDNFEIRTEGDYAAVFYNSGVCSNSIAVFERDYIFPFRYKILGSDIKSGEIGKFSYTKKHKGRTVYLVALSITDSQESNQLNYEITKTNTDTDFSEVILSKTVNAYPFHELKVFEVKNNSNYYFSCEILQEIKESG